MNSNPRHNAITQRLELLTYNWLEFTEQQTTKVCRWLVQYDETRMIDAFFELESTEHGKTDDLFLRFEVPFEKPTNYAATLATQLQAVVNNDTPYLAEEDIHINWSMPTAGLQSPVSFFQILADFRKSLDDFEGEIIAFLQPSNISHSNKKLLQEWILQAVSDRHFPDKVRIMLLDVVGYTVFDKLEQYPKLVQTLEPKLDMSAAMQQLAAAGDPTDPSVKFRKLFVEMSQMASKGQMADLERLSKKAMDISKGQGWSEMTIAVYNLLGSSWLKEGDTKKALSNFQQARTVASSAFKQGNPTAGQLLTRVFFFEAAVMMEQKNYQAAAKKYEDSLAISQQTKEFFFEMEAWRMIGSCEDLTRNKKKALDAYRNALKVAPQLEESIRQNSTLPYIGVATIRLMKDLGYDNEIPDLRKNIRHLTGNKDWETQVPTKKTKL